ncbi:sensor histidine kinase [Sutcliffiella rhizosphaerae]|uniref:histidine kinase n=1 Tax=Sutcliffiella rhizosphaerae TaxID=2880967 RepID=A0ABM8YQ95_9BACI|nr:sensor histidine kinase [Sutcliffiella rhizosphaerae]CAG9622087.1 hypothetical protein BACCIP111883_02878 [Sutcliffiella rhizosphaerae]
MQTALFWGKLSYILIVLLSIPFFYTFTGTILAAYLLVGGAFLGLYFSLPMWRIKWPVYFFSASVVVVMQQFIVRPADLLPWLLIYFLLLDGMLHRQKDHMVSIRIATVLPIVFSISSLAFTSSFFYQILLIIFLIGIGAITNKYVVESERLDKDWKSLLVEYRDLKRQLLKNEEVARIEERNRIARDIHDSVGHQLTALMMQLAVAEQSLENQKVKSIISQTKQLARDSLDGMRKAVKALQGEEDKGIASVIHLIRKLEAESQMRIQLTTKTGVLSHTFTNDQNSSVYRFVQEALTNAMRHGDSREITVTFEILGGHSFRATIRNKLVSAKSIQEGFGMQNMRKRMEDLRGRMEKEIADNHFIVKGVFPLKGET